MDLFRVGGQGTGLGWLCALELLTGPRKPRGTRLGAKVMEGRGWASHPGRARTSWALTREERLGLLREILGVTRHEQRRQELIGL